MPQMYKVFDDSFVEVTQDDVDLLTKVAANYGAMFAGVIEQHLKLYPESAGRTLGSFVRPQIQVLQVQNNV